MKTPNLLSSLKLIHLAQQALKTAAEDLKNDPDLRTQVIYLRAVEAGLEDIRQQLDKLDYAKVYGHGGGCKAWICNRCRHEWYPLSSDIRKACPSCESLLTEVKPGEYS